jgi:hypothetical protein
MHPDKLGLNENPFKTSQDAFGRNEIHLGAVCISEVGMIIPKCILIETLYVHYADSI